MPSRKTRVLILIDHLGTGGAQVLLRDALARHDRNRFEFYVCPLCEWRTPRYQEEYEGLGIRVFPLSHWKSLAAFALDLSIPFRISKLVRRLSIDVIEVHLYLAILPAAIVHLLVPRCPMVYTLHALRYMLPAPIFPLLRLVAPAFRMFSIGDNQRADMQSIGVPEERTWYTRSVASFQNVDEWGDRPSGVRQEFGIPEKAPVILNIGRLHTQKGQDVLLECFAEVCRQVPDAWLILVGDGPEERRLKDLAIRLAVTDRVVFPGFRRDLPNFFSGATVFAVTGAQEGMGLATLSAMASGLPVIAFDVGNLHRVVVEGRTGALVQSQDRKGFSAALVRFLTAPLDERRHINQAAKDHVRSLYSVDAFVADREAIYDHLLADRIVPS